MSTHRRKINRRDRDERRKVVLSLPPQDVNYFLIPLILIRNWIILLAPVLFISIYLAIREGSVKELIRVLCGIEDIFGDNK